VRSGRHGSRSPWFASQCHGRRPQAFLIGASAGSSDLVVLVAFWHKEDEEDERRLRPLLRAKQTSIADGARSASDPNLSSTKSAKIEPAPASLPELMPTWPISNRTTSAPN